MPFNSKKELQKLWESIELQFIAQLPKNLKLTDTDYSVGFNDNPNLGIQINKKWAFFIFSMDEPEIAICTHEPLPIDIIEHIVKIKHILMRLVYPKQSKQVKAQKAE